MQCFASCNVARTPSPLSTNDVAGKDVPLFDYDNETDVLERESTRHNRRAWFHRRTEPGKQPRMRDGAYQRQWAQDADVQGAMRKCIGDLVRLSIPPMPSMPILSAIVALSFVVVSFRYSTHPYYPSHIRKCN